jgi:hypothetical protein
MQVAIELPDDVSQLLQSSWGDVSRRSLEAVAAEAYRSGALSARQVGDLLGHASRWETETFLQRMQASLRYTPSDLEQDLAVLRDARRQ